MKSADNPQTKAWHGDFVYFVNPQNYVDVAAIILDILAMVALITSRNEPFWKSAVGRD